MKRAVLLLACLGLSACGGGSQRAQEAAPAAAPAPAAAVAKPLTAGWTATTGIMTPESAYYDAASGFIFSSQINGAPDAKDGNGSIAKLDGDGTVVKADFVSGLNAPKGLRVCNGTLWAADLGEVLAIDVATGAIKSRVAIPESMFLNDVACAGDVAYVTDMMGNKIFKVENNAATVAAEGAELEFPNGLLVDGNRLIVGGWGSAPKADFTNDVKGHLYSYNLGDEEEDADHAEADGEHRRPRVGRQGRVSRDGLHRRDLDAHQRERRVESHPHAQARFSRYRLRRRQGDRDRADDERRLGNRLRHLRRPEVATKVTKKQPRRSRKKITKIGIQRILRVLRVLRGESSPCPSWLSARRCGDR